MMTRHFCLLIIALISLMGCDRLSSMLAKPDPAVISAPAPPVADGAIEAYPAADGNLSLQVRPGDCAIKPCFIYQKNRWRPLTKADAAGVALLTLTEATGSAYSDSLWRPIGPSRAILINATAGEQNISSGRLDGLRIGMSNANRKTYITAYAIEPVKTPGSQKLAGKLYFAPPEAEIIAHEGKAWLLHRRADGSANMVDLYAMLARPEKIVCLPGLVLDTDGTWAGAPDIALSPNIFVSRAVNPDGETTRRQQVIDRCYSAKP